MVKKLFLILTVVAVLVMSFSTFAFAAGQYNSTTGVYESWTADVTAEQAGVVTTAVTDNLAILLPVGIGIMAIMIGVALIPRIVYKFF